MAPTTINNPGEILAIPSALAGIFIPHLICTLIVLTRAYSRLRLLRNWFPDDSLVALAWTGATIVCVMYLHLVHAVPTNSQQQQPSSTPGSGDRGPVVSAIRAYTPLIFYQLGLVLTKLSILAFYHRIFSQVSDDDGESTHQDGTHHQQNPDDDINNQARPQREPTERTLTRITISLLLVLVAIPLFLMTLLQCDPSTDSSTFLFFSPSPSSPSPSSSSPGRGDVEKGEKCLPLRPLLLTSTTLHAAFDMWLVLLAVIPCVARLRGVVSQRRRAALAVGLGLGVLVVVVGVVRGVVLVGMLDGVRPGNGMEGNGFVDWVWKRGDGMELVRRVAGRRDGEGGSAVLSVVGSRVFALLTVLELDVAIVCASAPTLRPVLVRVVGFMGCGGGRRGGRDGQPTTQADSTDAPSSVSHRGCLWRMEGTPAGSKRASVPEMSQQHQFQQLYHVGHVCHVAPGLITVPPVPPPPAALAVAMHRTPTTLSLRSFVSALTSRSRGRADKGPGRAAFGDPMTGPPGRHSKDADQDSVSSGEEKRRRRSSVGCETLYQYIYDQLELEARRQWESGSRHSVATKSYSSGGWGDSQESFVLGMNDPQSPKRLSPVAGLREGNDTGTGMWVTGQGNRGI
ncbi:hypothetical protein VTJ49DRAFT_7555 [Mycothermus thermophilus]|uniref:Rhodopsin domain-containing protein n=1 Tax=Humicola insolens TaxID=85995 RepID=A0ABR3VHT2_HUMIN